MNKFILYIITIGISSISLASPKFNVFCNDKGDEYHLTALFDSSIPSFSSQIIIDTNAPKVENYLSANFICGHDIKFSKNCQGIAKKFQGNLGYVFKCNKGISGEITLDDDQLSFSCSGPQVSKEYEHLIFNGCKSIN